MPVDGYPRRKTMEREKLISQLEFTGKLKYFLIYFNIECKNLPNNLFLLTLSQNVLETMWKSGKSCHFLICTQGFLPLQVQ